KRESSLASTAWARLGPRFRGDERMGRLQQFFHSLSTARAQLDPLELLDLVTLAAQAARDHLALPGARRAVDHIKVVGGGVIFPPGRRRGGGYADRGDRTARAVEPAQALHVLMSVQQQLGTMFTQDGEQRCAIDQPLAVPLRRADRRMVDQHDAERSLALEAI